MKITYAILIIIICVLIISNIDKLKAEAPKPYKQYINSNDCKNELSTEDAIYQTIIKTASNIFQGFFGYFGEAGNIASGITKSSTNQLNALQQCVGILHNEILDERTNFNYEKILVTLIGIVCILIIFKR